MVVVRYQRRRPRGLPESMPHRTAAGLRRSPPGPGCVDATVSAPGGRRTGLAEVLTRSADRFTFMETFPNVAAVRHEARRSGASVPGPYVCSLAPRLGQPRDWRVPRAARQ